VAASADIPSAKRTTSWTSVAIALCALFVLFRLFALLVSPLELGPDEAQYWRWSQTPAWGYFSKPPLIAWAIGATTHFFGDAEWAVRLFAPIAHAFCALFIARAAQRLAGKDAAAPAALLYLVAPGVALSSFLASTDALLLACSAAALLGALRIRERNDVTGQAIIGIALGLGFLAKYAMIYTVGGLIIAALFDRPLRQALLSWKTLIGLALAGLLIAPNLYWNATNSFATFHHTAANAGLHAAQFDIRELGEFVLSQFGVFGPVAFALLILALFTGKHAAQDPASPAVPARPLFAALVLIPLIAVSAEAFINRANANWAAIAYPPAAVLVTVWCFRTQRFRLLFAAIAVNAVLSLAILIGTASPIAADAIGASNAIKRVRGWDDVTRSIAQVAAEGPESGERRFAAVAFDNRLTFHEVDYYGRTRLLPPLRMWLKFAGPLNQAEAMAPLKENEGPVLFVVSTPQNLPIIRDDFAYFEPRGSATIVMPGKKLRHVDFYVAEGYNPRPRDADFNRRWFSKDSVGE
jgi:4-amino-4-deoxy-L-arabinose transferase-like glycosyltransferase